MRLRHLTIAAMVAVAAFGGPSQAGIDPICFYTTDYSYCIEDPRDGIGIHANTDCAVDVGYCAPGAHCKVNVGYCAPGGDCIVNVGYCDDNDLPVGL